MADKNDRIPENEEGRFYVDESCIDCGLCAETSPDNFTHDEEAGFSYVSKQPENEDEEELCKDAKEACPANAIGDDGE